MEVINAASVQQFSAKHELLCFESRLLKLSFPETLPMSWRRQTKSFCFSVLLMLEKTPPPAQMLLTIHEKNNRLVMKLLPCSSHSLHEELHALDMMAFYYRQVSRHILK